MYGWPHEASLGYMNGQARGGGRLHIAACITFSADIQKILDHIGVEPEAPRITPARVPPLWDECGA